MKYPIIFISIIFGIACLSSCHGNVPVSTPTGENDTIDTMVASTLTAIRSGTAPTQTLIPSTTPSHIPSVTPAPTQTTAPSATSLPALLGKYIAFCQLGEHNNISGLALINPDGSNLRSLQLAVDAKYPIPECLISFSPNGKYLASIQEEEFPDNSLSDNLVIYDVVSGEMINVTYDIGKRFSWSPDGNGIIFTQPETWIGKMVTSNEGIRFLDMLTGEDRQFFPPLEDFVIGDVNWSPDGAHLGIHRIQYEGLGDFATLNSDGAKLKQWDATVGHYSWSPDGKQIVYDEITYYSGEPSGLFISNVDESQTITLVDDGKSITMGPHWSPDGGSILFSKNLDSPSENHDDNHFWIISPDGQDLHQVDLSGIEGDATWVSWGPDSRRLVLSTSNTAHKIYVVSLDGTPPLFLAEGVGAIWMP